MSIEDFPKFSSSNDIHSDTYSSQRKQNLQQNLNESIMLQPAQNQAQVLDCNKEMKPHSTTPVCGQTEVVTSTELKTFLSSNVFDVRPDLWSTDFCLQKSNSFCSPSFAEERGCESWRDFL